MPIPRRRRAVLFTAAAGALVTIGLTPGAQAQTRTTPAPAAASLHLGSAATLPSPMLAGRGAAAVCAKTTLHCLAEIVTIAPGSSTPLSTTVPEGYGPADFAKAYNLPAGHAGTIAVLETGAYPTLENDLNVFRSQYGLPACTTANGCFKQVGETGGPPLPAGTTSAQKQWDEIFGQQTSIDVDAATAACPMCKIIEITVKRLVNASSDVDAANFGVAMNTAAKLGANAADIGFQFIPDATVNLGPIARDFYHPGMAITAASGDMLYYSPTGFPANLPTVTAVGGTTLYTTPNTSRGYTEIAWGGVGSGCAGDLPPAPGQPASVSALCNGHRADTDVSADADPFTGVAVYNDYAPYSHYPYEWTNEGGTSLASAFIAGLYARGGHLGQVDGPDTLYADPSSDFNDITVGQDSFPNSGCTNALCVAGPGWDGPSGLGTPNGLAGF